MVNDTNSNIFVFLKENAIWIVPITVVIIKGIFTLIKKTNTRTKQEIKNVQNSKITQIGGNQNINNDKRQKSNR